MALEYHQLSRELEERIKEERRGGWQNPHRFPDEGGVRKVNGPKDSPSLWRPVFVRDVEKILHLPTYNRYADKTQVLSFYQNDDITRRALHVQLVSRIARNIGAVLGLNLDLIEAISLGHDLGHTPFGHAGEGFLNQLYQEHTGRYFHHNVHSVRVLEQIFRRNLTLQTLDGILCHNGEFAQQEYRPQPLSGFDQLEARMEACATQGDQAVSALVPSTLEGCVVRLCDMVAYLGKDRQDARIARIIGDATPFTTKEIGTENAAIINNITVDLIENSYGKDHLFLSPQVYQDLKAGKRENFQYIYHQEAVNQNYDQMIAPMFRDLYGRLLEDLVEKREKTVIFRHHIRFVEEATTYYEGENCREQEPNQIVTDFIASMTDDYFLELHAHLFPHSPYRVTYQSYFEDFST